MSILEILVHPDVLLAVVVVTGLSLLEPLAGERLRRQFHDNAAFEWSWDHAIAPFFRVVLVLAFVLIAYPTIFGLYQAPPLGTILAAEDNRIGNLLGVLFALTIALPLLPVPGVKPAVLLPVQAILAIAAVFTWLKQYIGVTAASAWPGIGFFLLIVLLSIVSHRLVARIAQALGHTLNRAQSLEQSEEWFARGLEPWAQIPTMVFYGAALGLQLAP